MGGTQAAAASAGSAGGKGSNRVETIREFALAQPPRRVATILFAGIGLMAVLGAGERLGAPLGLFDFDGEGKPPAAFSALVLLAAAAASGLIATLPSQLPWRRRFLGLAAFLAFMAVDEAITLHELVSAAVGVAWQPLWLPIIAVGGIVWLLVLTRLWPMRRERTLLMLGAVAWFVSQVLERVQSNEVDGRVEGYGLLSSLEEIFEVSGSALFVLALLGALQILHRADAGREAPAGR